MHSRELGRQVADALLKDLLGRRGFRQVWDDIDGDIQAEIVTELAVTAEVKIREERDLKLHDLAHTWKTAADDSARIENLVSATLRVCAQSIDDILAGE